MSSFGYDARRLKRVKPACALIDTGIALGTGFLIGDGRMLSCEHVMRGSNRGMCRFGDDRSKLFEFRVTARYPEVDSVVLEAADPGSLNVLAPLLATGSQSRDEWWAWGFPAVVD